MSGIFPAAADGGLPPNPDDSGNPAKAYPPLVVPTGTQALYYGNGCDVRLRPEVINSLISEIEATVDDAELSYDPAKLTNLDTGVKYLMQRGLMSGVELQGGPVNYAGAMQPKVTRYNNFLTIRIVPLVTNGAAMLLSLDGIGYKSVLRNDGVAVQPGDLPAGFPHILIYYNGAWYVPYAVRSQNPPIFKGSVNYWVRTDGSDSSGDGSENTPGKAFRTIMHAWATGLSRYVANPELTINIRLGIPGTYDYAQFSRFPGTVGLFGDEANFAAYKLVSSPVNFCCVEVDQTAALIAGVCLQMDKVGPTLGTLGAMSWRGAKAVFRNCQWDQMTNAAGGGAFVQAASSGTVNFSDQIVMDGHGNTIGAALAANGLGVIAVSGYYPVEDQLNMTFRNMNFTLGGYQADVVSSIGVTNQLQGGVPMVVINTANTNGPKYSSIANSVIRAGGKLVPGSTAGTVSDGGVFNA